MICIIKKMARLTPEVEIIRRVGRLGTAEMVIYHLPVVAQRFLERVLPPESMARVIDATNYRLKQGFNTGGYPDPSLGSDALKRLCS